MAALASEKIVLGVAGNGVEVGSPSVLNPANRTLELSVDLRLKFRRSIECEVRKIKFRLLLGREVLRLQIFLIQIVVRS